MSTPPTPDGHAAGPLTRRSLTCSLDAAQLLRALRDEDHLVGLLGSWETGPALVAFDPAEVLAEDADPFEVLDETRAPGLGDQLADGTFGGGWIGLWGYPLGARVEKLPGPPPRPCPQPAAALAYYDCVLRSDPTGQWWFESVADPERADTWLAHALATIADADTGPRAYRCTAFVASPDGDGHRRAIATAREHIDAGDIFQANVCMRLDAAYSGDPLDLFLRGVDRLRPAYAGFVRNGDRAVASLSPELFLRRAGRSVRTAPIKGTAPLGAEPGGLATSAKNRAENIMIVDLMRNDLGRVCVAGTIQAGAPETHERTGVRHLVSNVQGTLRDDATDADLMRGTFPPGSVTGAPKVRAMEIIHEVESTGREAYTGALGYAGPYAGLELNVVIRTFEFAGDRVWLGVGGGIVADSTPDDELSECYVKAAPLLEAVGARLAAPPVAEPVHGTEPRDTGTSFAVRDGPLPDPGAGVFDTLLVLDGRPVAAPEHLARLATSARDLYDVSVDASVLAAGAAAFVAHLPGVQRLRTDLRPDGTVSRTATPVVDRPADAWTLTPVVLPGWRGAHKWADRTLLERAARGLDPATHDVLVLDIDGTVLETGRGSIFCVADGAVHTPALDGRILPGVARSMVMELLHSRDIPVVQRDLLPSDLAAADEVFVSNAVTGVRPVRRCETIGAWGPGRTAPWIRERLEEAWHGAPPPPAPAVRRSDAIVLLIDNYDSFVYNLAQYVEELGARADVIRNDAVTPDDVVRRWKEGAFTHVVVSPGPGTPDDAGISNEVIARLGPRVPILGVCLGHECIGQVFGASVVPASRVVHGKPSLVHHDGGGIYAGIDGPLSAARYHSLAVEDLPPDLVATAWADDGTLMGLRHRTYPVEGIQVHPESVLTPSGHLLLSQFLDPGRAGSVGPGSATYAGRATPDDSAEARTRVP